MKATTAVALGFCLAAVSTQAQVTSERLANAARDPQQWMTYPGAYAGSRFSPLDQINRTNVNRLALQWVFQTRVRGSHETTPLVIDGVMYLTAPQNHAYAIDVRTGRPLWHYERTLPKEMSLCCGPQNRGFAALGDRLFKLSKCPDYVVNRGHYFGTDLLETKLDVTKREPGLSDKDKRALIEFLKTF